MYQDIDIRQLLEMQNNGQVTLIDVRSPLEYADATIPGSVNIPLFDDAERAEIGTLYTRVGVHAAKDRGLEIVSAKLPAFIRTFAGLDGPKVLYCWRGGMRSRTSATLLSLMDIHVHRLQGGYRSYRQWVTGTLESFELRSQALVLQGHTGSGKTKVLRMLAERGYPVIDLEHLAGHRGSIFGHIGMNARNQKTFEAHLLHQLRRINERPYFLIEAESKRVGKVVIPEFLARAKEQGTQFFLEVPVAERVKNIMEDYRPHEHKAECIQAFERIKKRMHTPIAAETSLHLRENRYVEAVTLLLEHYYDPKYTFTMSGNESERVLIRCEHTEEAVGMIARHLQNWEADQRFDVVRAHGVQA